MRESMNRAEFMRQLECLLQSIPAAEREEALQYYNDYFDDAGDENEQEVIEALGNPARVAENIKHDLLESGYGETPLKKAVASDRKLIEYGKTESQTQANASSQELPEADQHSQENESGTNTAPGAGTPNGSESGLGTGTGNGTGFGFGAGAGFGAGTGFGSGSGFGTESGSGTGTAPGTGATNGFGTGTGTANGFSTGTGFSAGNGISAGTGTGAGNGISTGFGSGYGVGSGANNGSGYAYAGSGEVFINTVKPEKSGWPGWAIALLVVGLVFASPLILGITGTLIGVLASWIAVILSMGVATLALFLVFVLLIVVGIMCMFTDPISGIALVGGGLLCGGIGMLFLMLTVAMAGIVTPAIFRGIAHLLGWRKKK